jgi:hypothetical protein
MAVTSVRWRQPSRPGCYHGLAARTAKAGERADPRLRCPAACRSCKPQLLCSRRTARLGPRPRAPITAARMLDCEFVSCPHLRHDSSPSRRLIKTANGRRGSFRFKIEMLGHAQPSSRLIVTHLAEVKVGRLFSLAKAYSIARRRRAAGMDQLSYRRHRFPPPRSSTRSGFICGSR